MPLYEYECRDCNSRFEQIVLSGSQAVSCRTCGSASVVQLLSTFSVGGAAERSRDEPSPCDTCGAAERGMCGLK